eukprot:4400977-Prymnesium_polylepis.1
MSLEYPDAIFAKVDVDKASDVAELLAIRAMPTFKLFRVPANGSHMVLQAECTGWNEARVRRMLENNGVARVEPDGADASDEHCCERSKLMASCAPHESNSTCAAPADDRV